MTRRILALLLTASLSSAQVPDRTARTVTNVDLMGSTRLAVDGVEMEMAAFCTLGLGSGACLHFVQPADSVSRLPSSGGEQPFLTMSSSGDLPATPYTSQAKIDSLQWWEVTGASARWAVSFDSVFHRFGSGCNVTTGCRSWDTLMLRLLTVRMNTARPYVRWLDTLGTLGDRWEPFLRAWKGGPLDIGSVRGSLRAADGKPLASTFSPTASIAFTRTPIPNVTALAPARGAILYSQKLSPVEPAVTTGVLANAKVDTSGHLYAKASIQWVNDSLAPRLNPPKFSDTGSHPGWIRARAMWNFTVDGKADSVVVLGWVPDPEFSAIARKPSRKETSTKPRLDALGRPAVLRHQASDVRLLKP